VGSPLPQSNGAAVTNYKGDSTCAPARMAAHHLSHLRPPPRPLRFPAETWRPARPRPPSRFPPARGSASRRRWRCGSGRRRVSPVRPARCSARRPRARGWAPCRPSSPRRTLVPAPAAPAGGRRRSGLARVRIFSPCFLRQFNFAKESVKASNFLLKLPWVK
jgi:hypothetical protein